MKFHRIAIESDQHQLAAVVLAAERWLPQTAVNRTPVKVVAAMPVVASFYKRAASAVTRAKEYQRQGRQLPRGGRLRVSLTVPEAAAVMGYLVEQLLFDEEETALRLRLLRGSIHQQLSAYPGLAYES